MNRRSRTRPATIRSAVDIFSDQPAHATLDVSPEQHHPHISFPTLSPGPSLYPSPNPSTHSGKSLSPSPILGGLKSHPPSPKRSPNPTALAWRDVSSAKSKREAFRRTNKRAAVFTGALVLVALVLLYWFTRAAPSHVKPNVIDTKVEATVRPSAGIVPKVPLQTEPSFRDSLFPNARYLTSPQNGGFAHQVMSLYHLTYLSTILRRTPIVSPFTFKHTPDILAVSSVFDTERFKHSVSVALIDWKDLRPPGEGLETLGCWTAQLGDAELETRSKRMNDLGISPSFYPLRVGGPPRIAAGNPLNDLQIAYTFLSSFDADPGAQAGLIDQTVHTSAVRTFGTTMHRDPEEHVFCVDHSLFHTVSSSTTAHLDQYEHTAFRAHGIALRFVPELEALGAELAAFILGHKNAFVAVHLSERVPLGPYAAAIERVRLAATAPTTAGGGHLAPVGRRSREREVRHQVRALSVLVTTSVQDLAFRGEIVDMGWELFDRLDGEVRERSFGWPSEVMEQVVASRAVGFVGSKDNPESTLTALRVRAWRGGPVEIV